jgi:hypothetical protein
MRIFVLHPWTDRRLTLAAFMLLARLADRIRLAPVALKIARRAVTGYACHWDTVCIEDRLVVRIYTSDNFTNVHMPRLATVLDALPNHLVVSLLGDS